MKIVGRKEFLELPNGIVYSKYSSCGFFMGLLIKTDTWKTDWIYQDLLESIGVDSDEHSVFMEKAEKGEHFTLDLDCTMRDGTFNDSDLFAVYDKKDVTKLIGRISKTLDSYPL